MVDSKPKAGPRPMVELKSKVESSLTAGLKVTVGPKGMVGSRPTGPEIKMGSSMLRGRTRRSEGVERMAMDLVPEIQWEQFRSGQYLVNH